MNKRDLQVAKKSAKRVVYRNGDGISYEGIIEVLKITGLNRCWFLGESEEGGIICIPLVKLTGEEKQKIEYEKQSIGKMCRASAIMTDAQKEKLKEILKKVKKDYLLKECLFSGKILAESAPLKNFSLASSP